MKQNPLRGPVSPLVALLIALGVAGCSDDIDPGAVDDAPTTTSVEDFCTVWNDDMGVSDAATPEEIAAGLHEGAEKLTEVGTPASIGDSERNGFEVLVSVMADIDADEVEAFKAASGPDDLQQAFDLTTADGTDLTAFLAYAATTCA